MKWPRGKYNGRRIQGMRIAIAVHVREWRLRSIMRWNFGEPYFLWLCFTFRGYAEYEPVQLEDLDVCG